MGQNLSLKSAHKHASVVCSAIDKRLAMDFCPQDTGACTELPRTGFESQVLVIQTTFPSLTEMHFIDSEAELFMNRWEVPPAGSVQLI